jgi:hypothetical protein
MRGVFWIRVAGVLLALFTASFISFPSFPSTGIFTSTAAPLVNRALKGDRLPLIGRAAWQHELGLAPLVPLAPAQPQPREKVPVGCDSAFSPISAPRLADIFGRCTA